MCEGWEQIGEGLKVEVLSKDDDLSYPVYWIASVVKVAGRKIQAYVLSNILWYLCEY